MESTPVSRIEVKCTPKAAASAEKPQVLTFRTKVLGYADGVRLDRVYSRDVIKSQLNGNGNA
jgi:hypothetical protein